MANTVIQLKYSEVTSTPVSLNTAEPAYSNNSGKLFIGDGDNTPIAIGGKYYTSIIDSAASTATPSVLAIRDSDGSAAFNVVTANVFTGNLTGSLTTARDIGLDGDATGNVSFDGSSNVTLTVELTNTGVTAGDYGGSTNIPVFTVDEDGRITAAANASISTDLNIAADTGSNTVSLATDLLTFAGGDGITTSIDPTNNVKIDVDNTVIRNTGDQTITGNTTLSGIVSVDSNKITNLATPTAATDAATKEYVDTIASASLHYHDPVRVESPINLNAAYDNGTAGVGATLTNSGTQAALVIDGITLDVDDRVLIYQQSNTAHNGIYTVTDVGSESTNWVLTRATDADGYSPSSPSDLGQGDAFFVQEGNTGAGELYVMNTEGTITFGTTGITFVQISSAQIYSAGAGLTLSGVEFSITDTAVVAGSYGAASNTLSLTVNSRGQLTAASETEIAIGAAQITSGLLAINRGGTNNDTYTSGAMLQYDGSAIVSLANVSFTLTGGLAAGNTVTSLTVDDYGRVTAATGAEIAIGAAQITSGTLGVERGGTGAATFTTNGVLLGQGTSAITTASSSTEGHVLTINASGVPTFEMISGGTF